LNGHFEDAIQQLRHNSNLRYYAQSSTWRKIPRKLGVYLEEMRTSNSFASSFDLLNAVYPSHAEAVEALSV
jgi:hypothetical protein